jgi:single-stranded-DNA-specific exonuclease
LTRSDWLLKRPSPLVPQLVREAGVTPLQAQLLINRSISDGPSAKAFLSARLSQMADPMLLRDMDRATAFVVATIESRKPITIYGDYDADGLTSTALLWNFFSELGVPVSYYVPHRLKEGYGLNQEAVRKIAEKGNGLLLTVDCGISNRDEIDLAKRLGLEIVVTDHHQLPGDFEPLCPMVNPQRPDCLFPSKDLAGVGVAFLLAVSVRAALRQRGWATCLPDLREYLDLVALGTVADRAPILGQNRILVKNGMKRLLKSRWEGIRALNRICHLAGPGLTTYDLSFRLAPRLNAPGRMDGPELGMEILTSSEKTAADELAARVNTSNTQRQELERHILDQIEVILENTGQAARSRILFLAGENWHPGVLGIVASRLVDRYHRPALVMTYRDGAVKGSARSVRGFNIHGALCRFDHLFDRFGGHAQAAGFTLKAQHLDPLRDGLEEVARQSLTEDELRPSMDVDAALGLGQVDLEMVLAVEALAPFGEGNPEPVFLTRGLEVIGAKVIAERHLKLALRQDGGVFEVIGFGQAQKRPKLGKKVDMVFTPEIDHWQGNRRVRLRMLDICETADGIGSAGGARLAMKTINP